MLPIAPDEWWIQEEVSYFLASNVYKLFKAILPDPAANKYYPKYFCSTSLPVRFKPNRVRWIYLSHVQSLNAPWWIDWGAGYVIRKFSRMKGTPHRIDLSKIDFEALRRSSTRKGSILKLKGLRVAISNKLSAMVRLNKSRVDYAQKFQELIKWI